MLFFFLYCALLWALPVFGDVPYTWSCITKAASFSPRINGVLFAVPPPLRYVDRNVTDGRLMNVTTNTTVLIVNGGYDITSADEYPRADNAVWLSRNALDWTLISGGDDRQQAPPPFNRTSFTSFINSMAAPARRAVFHRIGGTDRTGTSVTCSVFSSANMQTFVDVDRLNNLSPCRADGMALTLTNGSIIVMGGRTPLELVNDVWLTHNAGRSFQLRNRTAPWQPRYRAAIVLLSGETQTLATSGSDVVLLLGGNGGSSSLQPFLNDVWFHHFNYNQWFRLTSAALWSPRASMAVAVARNGLLVLTGGANDETVFDDAFISFDGGYFWQTLPIANHLQRYGHMMAIDANETLIISAGSSLIRDQQSHNDVYTSDIPLNNASTIIRALNANISSAQCFYGLICAPNTTQTIINERNHTVHCSNSTYCPDPSLIPPPTLNIIRCASSYASCYPNTTVQLLGTNFNTTSTAIPLVYLITFSPNTNKSCHVTFHNSTEIHCLMPFIPTFNEWNKINKYWNIIRSNDLQSVINNIPLSNSYNTKIDKISGCHNNYNNNNTYNCTINNTIIINGLFF